MSGYFEIGVYHPKREVNVGTLWRSALQLGASGIFVIGPRYHKQHSDTLGATAHIPFRHFWTFSDFMAARPVGAELIAVEMGGIPLRGFRHPPRAVYLLGAEDHGLPKSVLDHCQAVVTVESVCFESYNVAVAGSIVMWHRAFGSVWTENGGGR